MMCFERINWILISLMLALFFGIRADAFSVVVQGDNVNLRAQSNLTSEVITQVHYGDVLKASAVHEKWVELVPPTNVAFWVHSEFLFEGRKVKARRLNVRAGPGTNYSIVGRLERNQEVDVIESYQDWRRISPPEGTSLWVAREYVMVPKVKPVPQPIPTPKLRPTPAPRPTATPSPVPTPTPIVKTVETIRYVEVEIPVVQPAPEPTPTVKPPPGLDLVPLPGQGSLATRKGWLKTYLLAGTRPTRFQLVRETSEGHVRTICYLKVQESELKPFYGKLVLIKGRDYWVRDESLPVMVPLSIEVDREADQR